MKNFLALLSLTLTTSLFAQNFESSLQIRPRYEFRNGFKTLLNENTEAAHFISQRSRLNLGYQHEALEVKLSMQNVSVWGDTPTMRLDENNGVSFFEAYGQYQASQTLRFKLGRQVLSYDNQRILGEVGWAQQAQSHDAALVSWLPALNHRLDIGAAYNAQAETITEIPYTLNSYQNLQFARYHMDINNVGFSFLLMNTGYEFDAVLQDREVNYIQTFGAFHQFLSGNLSGNVAAYGQAGKRNDVEVDAWYAGLNLNYKFSQPLNIGLGAEYFSGTEMDSAIGKTNSFTPLLGTNHGFNGLMDYFYVGNHQYSVGLLDLYGKIQYTSLKWDISIVPHIFSSAADIINTNGIVQDNYLGTEVDFSGVYKVQKDLSIGFGYSQMFANNSMEVLKGGDKDIAQNWAWIMVNFSPKLFSFTKTDAAQPTSF